nr:2-phosphosulfolactate phosphatase [Galbitalea soli]
MFPDSPSAVTPEAIAGRRAVVVPEPGGAGICAGVAGHPALVVIGGFRNRSAVAQWALEQQGRKSKRFTIAVIAAGERREDGSLRMTVEDLLGAGAVIDALATLGIDYCSPEAAAAVAAYTGLRNATAHLLNASASGRQLAEEGRRADVKLATATDVSTTVPVLREFHFTA